VSILLSARPGPAVLRLRRVFAFAAGMAAAANLFADFAIYRAQFAEFAAWWALPSVVGQVLGVGALLVVPWISRGPALRVVCIAFGVFGLLSIALIVPASGVAGLPDSLGAAWPLRVQSAYALALILAVATRWVWAYVGALAGLSFLARALPSESMNVALAVEDDVVNATVTVLLAILMIVLLRTGTALDGSAEEAVRAVRRDSAAAAQAIERRRVELLAHDEILYALRVVSMGVRSPTANPAGLASATLQRLDALDPDADVPTDSTLGATLDESVLAGEEFLSRLRGLATAIAPLAAFDADELDTVSVPSQVATALLDASGEALRNSVVHAGDRDGGVARAVRVRHREGILMVAITDNGRGFRPHEVSVRRMGVARSIVARMRAVPGGAATIDSAPGTGTVVELTWQ